jgi:hypothetical protein
VEMRAAFSVRLLGLFGRTARDLYLNGHVVMSSEMPVSTIWMNGRFPGHENHSVPK